MSASPKKPRPSRAAKLMAVTVSLGVLQRALRVAADRAVGHLGISQASAWALVTIGRQGDGARQGVVADLLGVEGPSLIRTLDQLVGAGLVERRDDPNDRRAKTLHLTPAGLAIREEVEAAVHALRAELFKGVPDADIDGCLRVFSALARQLGKADCAALVSEAG